MNEEQVTELEHVDVFEIENHVHHYDQPPRANWLPTVVFVAFLLAQIVAFIVIGF